MRCIPLCSLVHSTRLLTLVINLHSKPRSQTLGRALELVLTSAERKCLHCFLDLVVACWLRIAPWNHCQAGRDQCEQYWQRHHVARDVCVESLRRTIENIYRQFTYWETLKQERLLAKQETWFAAIWVKHQHDLIRQHRRCQVQPGASR